CVRVRGVLLFYSDFW
nr:immunoglobulin heavy chain junction region [Macaca mulatta]